MANCSLLCLDIRRRKSLILLLEFAFNFSLRFVILRAGLRVLQTQGLLSHPGLHTPNILTIDNMTFYLPQTLGPQNKGSGAAAPIAPFNPGLVILDATSIFPIVLIDDRQNESNNQLSHDHNYDDVMQTYRSTTRRLRPDTNTTCIRIMQLS